MSGHTFEINVSNTKLVEEYKMVLSLDRALSDNTVNAYISEGANQDTLMTGPYFGETGLPTVAFISPVFGIDEDTNDVALGFLIGIKINT